ncbi:MAG: hypothetical protein OEY23_13605 [Acidimicrobiia bacterium]|nr:hypothetical protein [Acidimicrobiia bacterium]
MVLALHRPNDSRSHRRLLAAVTRGSRVAPACAPIGVGSAARHVVGRAALVLAGIFGLVVVTEVVAAIGPALVADPVGLPPAEPVAVHRRTIVAGETLWSIAEGAGPGDVLARVELLTRLNGGRELVEGEQVVVPLHWDAS